MKRAIVLAAVVACAALAAPPAHAAGVSLFSGRTLGSGSAVNVSAGVPDLEILYVSSMAPDADLGAWFRFGYLSPVSLHGDTIWLAFGGTYKHQIRNYGRYNLALKIDFGPVMFFKETVRNGGYRYTYEQFNPGLILGPAMIFGIPVKDFVVINLGFGIPYMMTFRDEVIVRIPLGFILGGEFFLDQALTLNANFEVGPGVVAGAGDSMVDVYALFKVGITFGL